MSYVIGIDTGGTFTDSVLMDLSKVGPESIVRKAKAFTTHDELEIGIEGSLENLRLSDEDKEKIEKVVISTTLATNATVEGKIHKIGAILIGRRPVGILATEDYRVIQGEVNIKGRVLHDVSKSQIREAVKFLMPKVDSIAVSGESSVRNPSLEIKVRDVINEMCDLPVVCGHQLASDLGFLERTNTAMVNAGLLPIIAGFVKSIKTVLKIQGISAPVFVVKGDGSIVKIDAIKKTPVETVLSGPASSILGSTNLTGLDNSIVSDMGGTTTDMGVVRNQRVELSPEGAEVGDYRLRIKSAKLHTFALGGDSNIVYDDEEEIFKVGPERVLPACRGGLKVTPTDLMHYLGEFEEWDRNRSIAAIEAAAEEADMDPDEFVEGAKAAVCDIILENLENYKKLGFPTCAIGAPAETWYNTAKKVQDFNLIIPQHYEVANAVGAATAGTFLEIEAVVRPGEKGAGFLAHTQEDRFSYDELKDAVDKALEVCTREAVSSLEDQNLAVDKIEYSCISMFISANGFVYMEHEVGEDGKVLEIDDDLTTYKTFDTCSRVMVEDTKVVKRDTNGVADAKTDELSSYKYLETRIKVTASGKIFD